MVSPNYAYLTRRESDHANPRAQTLANRLRRYFDHHPDVSRDGFLLGALQHEIDARQPLTADDMRIHAWLLERQVILDRERSGWRAKAKRWFQR